ncbi:hypothetical protein PsorP6_002903 [Peronosclerospora sorghi]|uniref:Uncharacterized protein n=1 Tax=Peronosclerospora sorghi TaxID=230839 RepID=A0ACC0VQK2_9STRA|nr:hypothetical protein PsorP6_002903 [Peronosclerospora sorghi]
MAMTYDSWGSAADRFDGSLCLGIDLGTTNSCVGIWHVERNHVKILKNRVDRGRTTPSVVRFDPSNQQVVVGHKAIELETWKPVENTIRSVKRLVGQKFDSKATEVAKQYASYVLKPTAQGNVALEVTRGGKKVHVEPEEVAACILRELKASAEALFHGKTVFDNAVITVPAYFSDAQRKATLNSAYRAGFKTVRLLNEPTAAAIAYGLFLSGRKLVTVFDFGGGTLDVSVLRIEDGKFEVLGIGGNRNLGGDDITNLLMDHVLKTLKKDRHNRTRAQLNKAYLVNLRRKVEKAKVELSENDCVNIVLPDLGDGPTVTFPLSRHKLEKLGDPIWKEYAFF